MSKIYIRRGILLLAGALALGGTILAMRREKALKRPAPVSTTEQPAASSGDGGSAVIRFVKNPEMAPPFEARDISGKVVSRSGWGGKVVLLNFWATWCPPCVDEAPALIELQRRIAPQGGTILGVSLDDDQNAYESFLKTYGIDFPTYRDPSKRIALDYGTTMYPETYVIDRTGHLDRKIVGPQDWTSPTMLAYLDSVLSKN